MANQEIDPKFEYDAPNYVDFALLQQGLEEDENVDLWFESHTDAEDRRAEVEGLMPFTPNEPIDFSGDKGTNMKQVKEEEEEEPKGGRCTGILTQEPAPSTDTTATRGPEVAREILLGVFAGRNSQEEAKVASNKEPKKRPKMKPLLTENLVRRPLRSGRNKELMTGEPRVARLKPLKVSDTITLPQTPELVRRYERKRQVCYKTTEELELEKIEQIKKEAQKKLKLSRRSFQLLSKTSEPVPVKYSKPPTEAVEFHFKTAGRERSKSRPPSTTAGISSTQFPMTLRTSNRGDEYHPLIPSNRPPTPTNTVVKPFKFHLDSRFNKEKDRENQTIVPTAEAIKNFQETTPPRFHSNPHKKVGSVEKSSSGPALTEPKTPHLLTRNRKRPLKAASAAEKEEEEVAKMKEYKFKANLLDPKIFTLEGLHGVPKRCEDGVSCTVPKSPHLTTKERRRMKHQEEEQEKTRVPFKANPVPKDILEGVRGVPKKRPIQLTTPASPAMALKKRRYNNPREEQQKEEEENDSYMVKPVPLPNFSKVFQPILSHEKTDIMPFKFEGRYQNKQSLVQLILQKDKENEHKSFRANPMPAFGTPSLPHKLAQPVTQPQPFNLQTELRGQQHTEKFQEEVSEMEKQAKEEAEFKASDPKVLYKEPFVPQKSNKPLTDVSNVVLHLDIRHEQRSKHEAEKRQRDLEREQENLERQAHRDVEEAKELKEYRQSLVHKAQYIHNYVPVHVHPSERPLTIPKSPNFTDRLTRCRGVQMDV